LPQLVFNKELAVAGLRLVHNLQRDSAADKRSKLMVSSGLHFLHTLATVFPLFFSNALPMLQALLEVQCL
jgi:hypothetical protein